MKKILLLFLFMFGAAAFATDYDTLTSKKYVDDEVIKLQNALTENTADTVMVYTEYPGTVDKKGIYDANSSYATQTDSLVTAATANTAIQNAIDSEFTCYDPPQCTLFRIGPAAYTGKNLFDKNNLTRIHGYFYATGGTWNYAESAYSIRIPCKPDTTYTARYNGNSTQAVLSFASTWLDAIPTEGSSIAVTSSTRQNSPTINTPITLTTGANDKWLIVAYNVAEPQNSNMANNLQVEEGATATAYEPYVGPYMPQGNSH